MTNTPGSKVAWFNTAKPADKVTPPYNGAFHHQNGAYFNAQHDCVDIQTGEILQKAKKPKVAEPVQTSEPHPQVNNPPVDNGAQIVGKPPVAADTDESNLPPAGGFKGMGDNPKPVDTVGQPLSVNDTLIKYHNDEIRMHHFTARAMVNKAFGTSAETKDQTMAVIKERLIDAA